MARKVQIGGIKNGEDEVNDSLNITCVRYATDMLGTEVGYIL